MMMAPLVFQRDMVDGRPTYPQLYVSGKLIGGLDVMRELADEGELEQTVLN